MVASVIGSNVDENLSTLEDIVPSPVSSQLGLASSRRSESV